MSINARTFSNTHISEPKSSKEILDEMLKISAALTPDPLAEFMASKGFDPRKNGKLHLPADVYDLMAKDRFFGLPDYVVRSHITNVPVMLIDNTIKA